MESSLLYKVTVGEDVYLGTAEQVVGWMSKAVGAPGTDVPSYMAGIAERLARASKGAKKRAPIDVSEPQAFLESLRDAGVVTLEERTEASAERVDPKELIDEGPVAFGEKLSIKDLEDDVFEGMGDSDEPQE